MAHEPGFIITAVGIVDPKLEPVDEDIEQLQLLDNQDLTHAIEDGNGDGDGLQADKVTISKLLGRILVLEQQVTICMEGQPLVHQIFDKCSRLEQRLKKVNARLNKIASETSGDPRLETGNNLNRDPSDGVSEPDMTDIDPVTETHHEFHETDWDRSCRQIHNDDAAPAKRAKRRPKLRAKVRTGCGSSSQSIQVTPSATDKHGSSLRLGTRSTTSRYRSSAFVKNGAEVYRCKVCPEDVGRTVFQDPESLAIHYVDTHPIVDSGGNIPQIVKQRKSEHERLGRNRKTRVQKTKTSSSSKGQPLQGGPTICAKGCGRILPTHAGAKVHVLHCLGPAPYQCDQCPNLYQTRRAFHAHKRLVHRKRGHKLCTECGLSLTDQGMKYHMLMHTGSDRRKHFCQTCDVGFANLLDLQIHNRKHTGERPFACPQCDRRFKAQATLKIHMVLHTGCVCEHCGTTFGSMWHLRNHRRQEHAGAAAPAGTLMDQLAPTALDATEESASAPAASIVEGGGASVERVSTTSDNT